MAKRKSKRRAAERAPTKHPRALTPGVDPEPANHDDAARERWRFFAEHNRAWVARPRSFLDRVARFREEMLQACERAGATVARTAKEASALEAACRGREPPARYTRFRGECALCWPADEAPPHVTAARQDAARALSGLGAAEMFHGDGEEGKALEEYERAARHYERAGARMLEPLARRGARVDPKRATEARRQQAARDKEERESDLLDLASRVHSFLQREHGAAPRLRDLHATMHRAKGAPHVAQGDPEYEYECRLGELYDGLCDAVRQKRDVPDDWALRVPKPERLARVLPKKRLEAAGMRFTTQTR